MQLLENTDQHVGYDHRQESQAVESARHDQEKTDDQKDQVEVCEYIFFNDIFGRLRGPVDLRIDFSLRRQFPDLRRFQSYPFYFYHLGFLIVLFKGPLRERIKSDAVRQKSKELHAKNRL